MFGAFLIYLCSSLVSPVYTQNVSSILVQGPVLPAAAPSLVSPTSTFVDRTISQTSTGYVSTLSVSSIPKFVSVIAPSPSSPPVSESVKPQVMGAPSSPPIQVQNRAPVAINSHSGDSALPMALPKASGIAPHSAQGPSDTVFGVGIGVGVALFAAIVVAGVLSAQRKQKEHSSNASDMEVARKPVDLANPVSDSVDNMVFKQNPLYKETDM